MSNISIEKSDGSAIQSLTEQIRQKAYELFQQRDSASGSEVDDWVNAERQLLGESDSEVVEKDGNFEVHVSVPGFDAEDVHVTALRDALIVRGENTHHDLNESIERSLFRKFDLPAPINVDQVTAKLDHGILKVAAAKAA